MTTLKWNGPKALLALDRRTPIAIEKMLRGVYLSAANQLVPHDTGTLMRTGLVTVDRWRGVLSYNTPYAVRLHEHPEYQFQKGRQGKWVETVIEDDALRAQALEYLKKELGSIF